MKRVICVLLALCLLCGAAALAEVKLTKLSDIQNASFIYNSNLLRVRKSGGYQVRTVYGQAVTDGTYSDVEFEKGLIVASPVDGGLNSEGAFDVEGNVRVPFQYGEVDVLSDNWVLGIVLTAATADHYDYKAWSGDAYYLIDKVDVYSLAAGKCVATLPRANFADAHAVGASINIEDRSTGTVTAYDVNFNALGTVRSTYSDDYADDPLTTFRSNGQEGLMDRDGNVVMKPSFYSIYDFNGEYAEVYTGEKYGLIDTQGNVVVPAEYDDIKRSYENPYSGDYGGVYGAAGYFGVILDGKLGFVTAGGQVTCEPRISEKLIEFKGASATYADMEGTTHILAADGKDTVITDFERIYCADYSSGRMYRVNDDDYKYGLLDWHGQEVLPCRYNGLSFSGDGRYVLVDVTYDESELYEISYVEETEPVAQVQAAEAAQTEGTAPVKGKLNLSISPFHSAAAPEEAQSPEEPAAETVAEPVAEPATEPVANPQASANSAVLTLLDSAAALLDSDPAAAAGLISSAVTLLGESNESASGMLNSAVTLLNVDAAANALSAKTIVEAARAML